jgi:cytochrome c556
MRASYLVLGATAVVTLAIGGALVAQEKATGVVALRQAVMKANGAHAQALQLILTDQKQFMRHAAYHAEAIQEALEYVPALFPPDSMQPASNALPAIWENQAGFEASAMKGEELAGKLAEAIEAGDEQAALAAFAALGKEGCGGCHEDFRKKQE